MAPDLTKTQKQVLTYIKTFLLDRGYPPTRLEIQKHFGWKSANAAQEALWTLHRKGAIEIQSRCARGIRVMPETLALV